LKESSLVAVLLSVAFLAGAVIGNVFGFNPMISGTVAVVGSLFAAIPSGALAAGIDVSDILTDLGAYMKTPQAMTDLWYRLFTGYELAPYMKRVGGQTGKYFGISSSMSEVTQGWQSGWTPKGTLDLVPFENQTFRTKVDYVIDNIDDVVGSWLQFLHDEGKERKDWPLVKYILQYELAPKVIEEHNIAMCRGSYVAPTPGTPGAAIAQMDGLLTIIADQITATALTPIVTGAVSSTDALDKFETFADGITPAYADKGGIIFCSKTMERYYKKDYRATFGSTNDQAAKNNLKLDTYDMKIVGLEGFGTSQRMVFTPANNLLHLYDKIFSAGQFQIQQDKRDVIIMSDWHTGVGFNSITPVFANDQA